MNTNKRNAVIVGSLLAAISLVSFLMPVAAGQRGRGGAAAAPTPIRRGADGKPDLTGFYGADAGGANYGLEKHPSDFLTPGTQGVVSTRTETAVSAVGGRSESIGNPRAGYDDPTAHCLSQASRDPCTRRLPIRSFNRRVTS